MIVLVLVNILFMAIVRGWALSWMWTWFVEPLGFRPIGLAHALGVSITLHIMTYTPCEPPDEDIVWAMGRPYVVSIMGLGLAWIVSLFM